MSWRSQEPCLICGFSEEVYEHHIFTRKAFPEHENKEWNRIPLCNGHHAEIHSKGTGPFANKYSNFKNWLKNNKWFQCELTAKWRHDHDQ